MTKIAELPLIRYDGNGVTDDFSAPFEAFALTDIDVELYDANNEQVAIYLDGVASYDYAVTGVYNATTDRYGTIVVTFNTPPPTGYDVGIARSGPQEQTLDIAAGGTLSAESLERRLDRLTALVQDLQAQTDRAPLQPIARGDWYDFNGKIARNALDPVLDQDLVTKAFLGVHGAVGAAVEVPVVASIAALKALDTSVATRAFVTGYYAALDGGGGMYVYDAGSAATDNGGTIIEPDVGTGRWRLVVIGALSVHQFGAKGDGTTDDTDAIKAACAALQTAGGGTLYFSPKTYLIYPTGTLSGSIIMNTFTSLNGVSILGRGAEILVEDVFAGSEALCLFQFLGVVTSEVGGFTFTSDPEVVGEATTRGVRPVLFQTGCVNIHYHDIVQTGGMFCFSTNRTVATQDETFKSRNITIERVECSDIGYPLGLENSGDSIKVRNFKATRAGRAVAIYGIRRFDIEMTLVDPHSSPSCYLTTGITSDSNYLEDGRISVTTVDSESDGAQANTVAIYALWDNTEQIPSVIRNIKVEVNARIIAASGDYAVFSIGKVVNGVGADASDRGHIIDNITLSGSITDAVNRVGIVDLMQSYGTWGSGDFVRNLSLDKLTIDGSGTTSIKVNLAPVVDHLVLNKVHAPNPLTVSGAAQYGALFRNSKLGTMRIDDVQYSVQTLIGSVAIDSIHRTAHLDTTGGGAYTLADGIEGQRMYIVLKVHAGDAVVTPANLAGALTTLTFSAVGHSCELLFTNAAWHLIGSYGVAAA